MKNLLVLALLLAALPLAAQDVNGDGVLTYLLPINAPASVPGAHGTEWVTEVWVHNGLDHPAQLAMCGPPGTIPPIGAPCATNFHPAGSTQKAFPHETPEEVDSVLWHLAPASAPNVVISSRLFELSRLAQPVGVELPIVREDAFLYAAARLIAVPRNASSRVSLRLYDPRARKEGLTLRVRAVDAAGAVVAERLLPIEHRDLYGVPNVAFISDLAAAIPELASVDRYDLVITPVLDGAEYWAFVSVTDNDTQQVFTITPQQ